MTDVLRVLDFTAAGDGTFAYLTGGDIFELGYADGSSRRVWRYVDAPFLAQQIAIRPDGQMFAVAADGAIWQRLPDRLEHASAESGSSGYTTVRVAEWRKLAGPPIDPQQEK